MNEVPGVWPEVKTDVWPEVKTESKIKKYDWKVTLFMYRAVIVEDDSTSRDYLCHQLKNEMEKNHIPVEFECYESGERFLGVYEEHYHYDIIFLDIEMPGIDGIEVCRQIRARVPGALVIFISSQESLVFDTFEVQPFRFVRKSSFEKELPALIRDLEKKLAGNPSQTIQIIENGTGDLYSFDPRSILYVEAQRKFCRFVTETDEVSIQCTLTSVEKQLLPFHFLKPHRSYLVNYRKVFYISRHAIILTNKEEIPVSRGQLDQVKQEFLEFSHI